MSSTSQFAFRAARLSMAAMATAVTVLAFSPALRAGDTLSPGSEFPNLGTYALEGAMPELGAAKVVIVDFWASWCGPCKASFPVFDDLHKEFGSQGLVIVAVSVDQNAKAMESFLKRLKPSFPVVRDTEQKLVQAASVPTMPTSYVLDSKGVVRFVHVGFHGEQSRREYAEQIKAILAEAS